MDSRKPERIGGAASLRAGRRAPDFTLDGECVSLAARLRTGPVVLSSSAASTLAAPTRSSLPSPAALRRSRTSLLD